MRRAIIATVGTVAALVAVLDYKSAGGAKSVVVAVPSGSPASSAAPTTPSTSAPSSSSSAGSSSAAAPSSTTASPTTAPATTTPPTTAVSGQFTGTDVNYQYGEIEARITVVNGKITSITYPIENATDSRSQSINSQALPILTREALDAQSLHIDVVSGATYTSDAFAQTLQAALQKIGK